MLAVVVVHHLRVRKPVRGGDISNGRLDRRMVGAQLRQLREADEVDVVSSRILKDLKVHDTHAKVGFEHFDRLSDCPLQRLQVVLVEVTYTNVTGLA